MEQQALQARSPAANSLVGSTTNDRVGTSGITELTNGNYVVKSNLWDNGATANAGAATWGSGTAGVVGTISSANSVIGPSASAGLGTIVEDSADGTFFVRFTSAERIYGALTTGPVSLANYDNFTDQTTGSVTLSPSMLTATLNAGTNVTLQASNDITVSDAITANNPGGNGGVLTFQAGRSILLNADITTDDGNLTMTANDTAASGVVNAQRDAGAAVITMGAGVSINAGAGDVSITLSNGAGNTNHSAGSITLNDITANSIFARNVNSSGDIILNGTLTASGAGTAITLASSRNFINNLGAGRSPLPVAAGWSYSTNPSSDTLGGLSSAFVKYACVYGGSCPAFPGAGNGFLYSYDPNAASVSVSIPALSSVPTTVTDVIALALASPAVTQSAVQHDMIYAHIRLLEELDYDIDMPNPWWDGIVW